MEKERTFTCVCFPDEKSRTVLESIRADVSSRCGSQRALTFPVHFSLRNDFKIAEDRIDGLVADLNKLTARFASFEIEIGEYGFYPWKVAYIEIVNNKNLQRLHEEVMELTQKYRSGWISQNLLDSFQFFEPKQAEYVKKYGYQFAFEYYSSHFTIAGNDMTEEAFSRVKNELSGKSEQMKVMIDNFVLLDRDDNSVFAEFALSGK